MDIVKLRQKVKIRTNGHVDARSERRQTQGSLLWLVCDQLGQTDL